jgi:hypothetical protein
MAQSVPKYLQKLLEELEADYNANRSSGYGQGILHALNKVKAAIANRK